jgi:hypothetical protein
MKTNAVFVSNVETLRTGGNCMADMIELKNGKAIVLTDECLALYNSRKDFHDNGSEDCYRYMDGCDGFARYDSPAERSPCGLTFVEAISTYEPDGPVSVDLLVLADGRVLGVDTDTAVLYPSMEAFDAAESVAYPTIDL